uniref:Uncharacterized protein n=1 Tax=Glossina palpalis gambiensis TaxID=67801 RepID=A0A1B0BVN0_9MUSC
MGLRVCSHLSRMIFVAVDCTLIKLDDGESFTNVAVVSSPSFSSFNGFMVYIPAAYVQGNRQKLQEGDDGGGGALVSLANRTVQFHSSLKVENHPIISSCWFTFHFQYIFLYKMKTK